MVVFGISMLAEILRSQKNKEFWVKKLNDNKARNVRNREESELNHWKVITIWECKISTNKNRLGIFIIDRLDNEGKLKFEQ